MSASPGSRDNEKHCFFACHGVSFVNPSRSGPSVLLRKKRAETVFRRIFSCFDPPVADTQLDDGQIKSAPRTRCHLQDATLRADISVSESSCWTCEAGQVVCRRGHQADCMFFIVTGELEVILERGRTLGEQG